MIAWGNHGQKIFREDHRFLKPVSTIIVKIQQEMKVFDFSSRSCMNAPNHFLVRIFKGNYVILKGEEGTITDFIEEIGEKSMTNFHFRMESLREVLEG